ncbi:hypothetical protein F5141DRAFT_1267449 [Pisolithus sp. B1]|nr:hypothetical protein F5141DRAFT_1267449 [Pisolithus sp. B1]
MRSELARMSRDGHGTACGLEETKDGLDYVPWMQTKFCTALRITIPVKFTLPKLGKSVPRRSKQDPSWASDTCSMSTTRFATEQSAPDILAAGPSNQPRAMSTPMVTDESTQTGTITRRSQSGIKGALSSRRRSFTNALPTNEVALQAKSNKINAVYNREAMNLPAHMYLRQGKQRQSVDRSRFLLCGSQSVWEYAGEIMPLSRMRLNCWSSMNPKAFVHTWLQWNANHATSSLEKWKPQGVVHSLRSETEGKTDDAQATDHKFCSTLEFRFNGENCGETLAPNYSIPLPRHNGELALPVLQNGCGKVLGEANLGTDT